jgi:hypothetical protein
MWGVTQPNHTRSTQLRLQSQQMYTAAIGMIGDINMIEQEWAQWE